MASDLQEYLIAKNFNIVFEAIIDELVGDRREELPDGLKEQEDGKRVDHLYSYKGLTTTGTDDTSIYYIGDSKYYQLKNEVSKESVYKQYTYARNVIQWNLNIFLNPDQTNAKWRQHTPMYRDEVTEGYNIVPNFFISARMDEDLSYADNIYKVDKEETSFMSKHFENRLFDRDTLLIYHYDVNFLYVVSLYAQDNDSAKHEWKDKVRKLFREEIQKMLESRFDFYAMTAHPGVDARQYIQEHFQNVLGKMYKPYPNPNYFSLALDSQDKYAAENQELLKELRKHFFVEKMAIGADPTEPLTTRMKSEGHLYSYDHSIDKAEKCVLTGYIPKNESEFDNFNLHKGKRFDMRYIPSINLMSVKYFMPMVDGFVDGYYKVQSISFKNVKEEDKNGNIKESMFLHLSLGDFTQLGDNKVFFYKVKMTAGQLHSISKIESDYSL